MVVLTAGTATVLLSQLNPPRNNYFPQKNTLIVIIIIILMTCRHAVVVCGLFSQRTGSVVHRLVHTCITGSSRSASSRFHNHSNTDLINFNAFKDETEIHTHHATTEHSGKEERIKKWLVVGDGDLSYSTKLARSIVVQQQSSHNNRNYDVQLIASVLETADEHTRIYRHSAANVQSITASGSTGNRTTTGTETSIVLFEIDATRLERHFQPNSLHRIIFNFPHWIGKSNNRYNRQLLHDFFKSAAHVLHKSESDHQSEIHVTLCHHQGGADATTLSEWKQTWMIHSIAAEHGLLLQRLDPFMVDYNLSSHRGVDRPFHVGENPLTYVFGWPNQRVTIPTSLQIAFRFELRILLIPNVLTAAGLTSEQIQHGDTVVILAQELLPHGIVCHIPMRNLIPPAGLTNQQWPLLVFLIVYSGAQIPLSRDCANKHRLHLEDTVEKRFGKGILLRKSDRIVSYPFPYHILSKLIEERSSN